MRFPAALGVTGIGSDGAARRFWVLYRQLQGNGYASSDESMRDREVRAIAHAPAIGANTLKRSAMQGFVSKATEALREWETDLHVPNDVQHTILERQERLVRHASTRGVSRSELEAAIARVTDGLVDIHVTTREEVENGDAEDETIHNVAFELDDTAIGDPRVRRELIELFRTILPAQHRGHHTIDSIEDMLIVQASALLNTSDRFGKVTIGCDAPRTPHDFEPARHISYGPNTVVRAEDVNALQDLTLVGPISSSSYLGGLSGISPGGQMVFFQYTAASGGGVANIETALDWRDRLILFVHIYENDGGGDDIRPGQAQDGATRIHEDTLFLSGAGGVGFDETLLSGLVLRVTAGGDLQIVNPGANTANGYGFAWATGDLGKV